MCSVTRTGRVCCSMPPEEDARLILLLAQRHETSLAVSLDEAFAQENWGFIAQQCVENLLKALIVLGDAVPPLTHDLANLQSLAGVSLPEELIEIQDFAVKARYSPEATPLPASREHLLGLIRQLRAEVDAAIEAAAEGPWA
jgi:HEPN domain-containing protein